MHTCRMCCAHTCSHVEVHGLVGLRVFNLNDPTHLIQFKNFQTIIKIANFILYIVTRVCLVPSLNIPHAYIVGRYITTNIMIHSLFLHFSSELARIRKLKILTNSWSFL